MSLPILLVDDNPDACATAAKLLWACGYQADVAYDASSALRMVDHTPYGLAIIDLQLEQQNGIELFAAMRHRLPHLAGILLTGYSSTEVDQLAAAAGIAHVLPKPADFGELIPLVEEFAGLAV